MCATTTVLCPSLHSPEVMQFFARKLSARKRVFRLLSTYIRYCARV
jgi:hypothetical protein